MLVRLELKLLMMVWMRGRYFEEEGSILIYRHLLFVVLFVLKRPLSPARYVGGGSSAAAPDISPGKDKLRDNIAADRE